MDQFPNNDVQSLIILAWNHKSRSLNIDLSLWALLPLLVVTGFLLWKWGSGNFGFKDIEIDQAEMGLGAGKIRFKPNVTDKQVAYAIWVELSTRKIGLPIDLEHDVVTEVYDSWYAFFAVTRDLLKGIPVNKVQNDSTQKIISLSIEVLNQGLRPHLTRWQARFRHWYERELKAVQESTEVNLIDPQCLQSRFPDYEQLKIDMERVNGNLINYRSKMHQLIMRAGAET